MGRFTRQSKETRVRWGWLLLLWLALPGRAEELTPVTGWLSGAFSSAEQAAQDRRFERVELRSREIWRGTSRTTRWIYFEQYLSHKPAHPFRQRIFRLTPEGGGVVRMVEFTMPRAIDFAGAWRTPALLDGLTPDQLSHRQGCDLLLRRLPSGDYEGRNQVGECATDFAGATTLVQYLWVGPRYIRLLDRAYDDAGTLRWGSPGEGYVYLRH